jgi:putative component of toxin-antitoxin plasmid stabilization module
MALVGSAVDRTTKEQDGDVGARMGVFRRHEAGAGFRVYLQANAKTVHFVRFCFSGGGDADRHEAVDPTEVGCWRHARRKYWEVAMAKNVVAREALARIARVFGLDAS